MSKKERPTTKKLTTSSLKIITNDRAKIDGDVATVGITDHAQAELGDIVYVELPEVGSEMEATKSFGVVESVAGVGRVLARCRGPSSKSTKR